MNPFDVDTDRLRQTVADMEAVEAELRDLELRLDRTTTRLQSTWSGRAATAHESAQQRWDHGLATMRDALGRMRGAAGTAHDHYARAADTNARMWTLG